MSPNSRSSLRRKVLHVLAITVSLAVVVSLGGCSSSGSGDDTTPSSATTQTPDVTVEVVLNDKKGLDAPMTIDASPRSVDAGTIEFTVKNDGTIKHELVLMATNGKELTPGADGKVSEDGVVFSIRDIPPGQTRGVISDLQPGEYELFCNIKGHYADGQHVSFKVK